MRETASGAVCDDARDDVTNVGTILGAAGAVAAGTIAVDQAAKAYVRGHAHERTLVAHDGREGTLPVVWDPSFTDEGALVFVDNEDMLLGNVTRGEQPLMSAALLALPIIGGAALYAGATLGAGRIGSAGRVAAIAGAGLLVGGALSNGVEKLTTGKATDYLFVSRQMVAWNLADVALAAGGLVSTGVIGARVLRGFLRH